MSREWKPGDVAAVRLPDGTKAIAIRSERPGEGCYWQHSAKFGGGSLYDDIGAPASTLRPLVVIDAEDREQVTRLATALKETGIDAGSCRIADYSKDGGSIDWARALTDKVQAALRSLVAPEKPPEPTGLGAVVEDENSRLHTKVSEVCWVSAGEGLDGRAWSEIAVVRVLSEGVPQ